MQEINLFMLCRHILKGFACSSPSPGFCGSNFCPIQTQLSPPQRSSTHTESSVFLQTVKEMPNILRQKASSLNAVPGHYVGNAVARRLAPGRGRLSYVD